VRPIVKGAEPAAFTAWKAKANADWQPTSWEDLQKPEKPAVLLSLLREQGFICCYCEDRITGGKDSHIEHLQSRHAFPQLMFDYGNLLACCHFKTSRESSQQEPPHCGHAKGNEVLPVHPLMAGCRDYFDFSSTGAILPRGSDAVRTIQLLQLDLPLLEARRRKAIDGLLDALGSMSDDELRMLADGLDERDAEGQFTPFCSTLVRVLEQYLPTT
jgi:uncharacterized protein (TIGR02646 family)